MEPCYPTKRRIVQVFVNEKIIILQHLQQVHLKTADDAYLVAFLSIDI